MNILTKVLNWAKRLVGAGGKPSVFDWSVQPAKREDPAVVAFNKEREWQGSGAEGLTAMAELCIVMITLLMVFSGLDYEMVRDHGNTLRTHTAALAISMGLTMAIYSGFIISLKTVPLMTRTSTYVAGWVGILGLVFFAVGTSSWYAFEYTAGKRAVEIDLLDRSEKLVAAVKTASEQLRVARGMPGVMEAKAQGFGVQSDSEVKGGGATGAAGAGPLSQALAGAAAVLRTSAAEIRSALDKSDAEAAALREKVKQIQTMVSDREVDVLEREKAYYKGAADVQAGVLAMNSSGLVEIVKASLVAVRSAVSAMGTEKSAIGERQQAAISTIRADMEKIAVDLDGVLGGFTAIEQDSGKLVQMKTLSEVVWVHKEHFIPALLIALGLDIYAAWALYMHALYRVKAKRAKDDKEPGLKGVLGRDEVVGSVLLTPEALKLLEVVSDGGSQLGGKNKGKRA